MTKKNTKAGVSAKRMPNNIELEQTLLGCALIDDIAAGGILSKLSIKDFYSETNQKIFEALQNLYNKGTHIDYITLSDELDRLGSIEEVGGLDFIISLSNIVPSAVHWESYLELIHGYSVNRSLISACERVITKAYQGDEDALQEAERSIFKIAETGQSSSLVPINESLKTVMDDIEEAIKDGGKTTGVLSGYHAIDNITNGFQKSDLVLIAARPSVGKTALGIGFILNAAKNGKKCAFFDLEMSREQLVLRMLSSITSVDMMKIMSGRLNANEMKKVIAASKELAGLPIYIDDSSLNTPGQVISKCRKLKREQGLDLVLIDYLQLMYPEKKSDSRQQDVSDISRQMKIFAKELSVPVLVLSQLSRAVEHRADKRPVLSDLRESGAIEQDADIVMFIHRPEELKGVEVEGAREDYIVDIIFAKHRNGKVGTVKLGWKGSRVSYVNLSNDSNEQSLYDTLPPVKSENTLQKINIPSVVSDHDGSDLFED